jgi:hypothetical protein
MHVPVLEIAFDTHCTGFSAEMKTWKAAVTVTPGQSWTRLEQTQVTRCSERLFFLTRGTIYLHISAYVDNEPLGKYC